MNKKIFRQRKRFFLWLIGSIAVALGLNFFFYQTGLLGSDEGYVQAAESLYAVSIGQGLLLYAVLAPVFEELLFRGLLFNIFKKYTKAIYAAALSAVLFGIYHGNVVQAVYGSIMGFLFACAYEDTETFFTPVCMHGVINAIVFLISSH